MATQNKTRTLWEQVQPYRSYIPSLPVFAGGTIMILGAVLILALPEESHQSNAGAARASMSAQTVADETACERQAWPYIDQRCANRVEKARDTRQVRIVTDKGTSVNVVTPVPIVEPKRKPAPAAPVVAQADRPIGPAAAPSAPAGEPSPQTEKVAAIPQPAPALTAQNHAPAPAPQSPAPQVAAAPAPRVAPAPAPAAKAETASAPATVPSAAATNAMAMEPPAAPKTQSVSVVGSTISIAPSQASAAPMAPGADAIDESRPAKSKSARQQRAERREARRETRREARQKALNAQASADVPEDVVNSVRSAPAEGRARTSEQRAVREDRGSRRARTAVPDEVIAAVEEATSGRGRRGVVSVGSTEGGRRIYIVPAEPF